MTRHEFRPIFLLWLIGNAARLTILAVPPVLTLISSDLGLSGTQIGILSSLPVVLLALAAVPGSMLIARFGALRTAIAGLWLTALGGALRGIAPDVWTLYAATILMGAGVAVIQTALPSLVRQWLPGRINLSSAVATNGMLVGEIIPIFFTALMLPLFLNSWRAGIAVWSAPVAVIALAVFLLAPSETRAAPGAPPARWWPDWSDRLTWRFGFMLCAANTIYFGSNAFIPGLLTHAGRPDLIQPALFWLNMGQIPASLLLIGFARVTERRIWPFLVFGLMMLAALSGMALTASGWTVFYAGIVGFAGAGILALCLALPAALVAPPDIGRMAAAMFVIGYSVAVAMAVAGGALWDLTGDARFAFLPLAIGGIPLVLLAPSLKFPKAA